jgi:hypothetical protein
MSTDSADFPLTLILEAKQDPICRDGYPGRDPMYRLRLALKRLLRDYGLRAIVVRNPTQVEQAALLDAQQC